MHVRESMLNIERRKVCGCCLHFTYQFVFNQTAVLSVRPRVADVGRVRGQMTKLQCEISQRCSIPLGDESRTSLAPHVRVQAAGPSRLFCQMHKPREDV